MLSLFRRQPAAAGVPSHVVKWAMDAGSFLGRAFVAQGIGTRLEARRVNPHVILFEFLPVPPTPQAYTRLCAMSDTVKATLRVSRCHISRDGGYVVIRVPNPYAAPLDPLAFTGGSGVLVPVGLADRGGVETLDFDRAHHVGIFGPSGAGKTTIARMIVLHLARQNAPEHLRLFVIGADAADWGAVDDLPHSWGFVQHADAPAVLSWLIDEMDRRQHSAVRTPRIVALIDDAVELTRRYPAVTPQLAGLSSQARHAAIHLVVISQRATKAGAGDTTVLANIRRRFVVGSATATEAAISAGRPDTGAQDLALGEALSVGGGRDGVVAVPDVPAHMLYQVAGGVRQRAPWEEEELAAPPQWLRSQPPQPVAQPVATASTEPVVPAQEPLPPVATQPQPVATSLPVVPARPLTAEEASEVQRWRYEEKLSLNELTRRVYGFKDGKTFRYIQDALGLTVERGNDGANG